MYARLNHVGVALSYTATLEVVSMISSSHNNPIKQWIDSGVPIKFFGDNIQEHKTARDIRLNHYKTLMHMYSLGVIRCRVHDPSLQSCTGQRGRSLILIENEAFLPSKDDISAVKMNLTGRIVCKYIKYLMPLSSVLLQHIPHKYSNEMARKSEACFLDVLLKNEACHSDMLYIMSVMQGYLGKDYPEEKQVLSGGDQLKCERQYCAQRHLMDADTARERLELVVPVIEDWHTLMW